ncbi:MAG: phosphate acyltransferase PlsX [Rhodospirillales bacterium]
MAERITIAVDAMGGEGAPAVPIDGMDMALGWLEDVDFLIFGDEARLAPLIKRKPRLAANATIIHTTDVVEDADKPAQALRGRRESSMRKAINAVGEGRAAGVVSAGNTGALMAMGKFVLKTLPGINRPALPVIIPAQRGAAVLLDVGANIDCSAEMLVQFAVMGEAFARTTLKRERPTIGILNVGSEDMKGNQAVRDAAAILQNASDLPAVFYGFVEGADIPAGTVDVVVTDGFTGNIVLKVMEGSVRRLAGGLREALTSSMTAKLGALLARPALNRFKDTFDPRRHNGAMLLGLNQVCVKSHGGTDGLGFANAVKTTVELVRSGINADIKAHLQSIPAAPDPAPDPAPGAAAAEEKTAAQ